MTGKHTASPWRAEIGRGTAIIQGADGDTIAVMALNASGRQPEEQIANAHILGASAELMEALEAVMLPLQAALDDCARIDPRDMLATLARARAVLRKARGIGVPS